MGKQKAAEADASRLDEILQAVLLTDSFDSSWEPLSLESPKVLLPLNQTAMIDYSLRTLARSRVDELVVIGKSDAVARAIQESSKRRQDSWKVTCIVDPTLATVGDALREIDRRNVIESNPFILMFGDVVTNVNLQPFIQAQKQRYQADRSAIMTVIFHSVGDPLIHVQNNENVSSTSHSASYSLASPTDDLIVGLDSALDNRVLLYDNKYSRKQVHLPCSFLTAHSSIEVRTDLADTGIYICSPEALARFTDEFDYQSLTLDFIANSVAEEEEGLQNKIYASILGPTEYAARVTDMATYASVSRDLLQGWAYPIGLEAKIDKTARMGRTSTCTGMLGAHSMVGDDSHVQNSVVGSHVDIGSHVSLVDCHVWDNVFIHDNVQARACILGRDCVIMEGVVLEQGCVIGAGCVIGKGVQLPAYSRITLASQQTTEGEDDWGDGSDEDDESEEEDDDDNDDDDIEESPVGKKGKAADMGAGKAVDTTDKTDEVVTDHDVVGPDGKGRLWKHQREEDDADEEDQDEDDDNSQVYKSDSHKLHKVQTIGFNANVWYDERRQDQAESEDEWSEGPEAMDDALGRFNDESDDVMFDGGADYSSPMPSAMIVGRQKGVDVIKELKSICLEYELSSPIENLAIELNSFKFSQNASYKDCTHAAMLAILERITVSENMSDGKLVAEFQHSLSHWAPLLQKLCMGVEEEGGILLALEATAVDGSSALSTKLSAGMAFRLFLQTLHQEDILSEEAILAWAEERRQEDSSKPRAQLFHRKPVQDFLEWLAVESEDDSDGDEDDDGDDDDDDEEDED
jgi:translation initiation factor eIF-2B subunit epsilon